MNTTTITAPAAWAPYLINGDASDLDDLDILACDAFAERIAPRMIVGTADDESRFTWTFDLYGGNARGGDVIDYLAI